MWMLLAVALIASNAVACSKGCEEHQGVCACDQMPEQDKTVQEIPPSNEKPSHHPEPAWQRGEVKADTPPSLASQDAKEDLDRKLATDQGKKAAGL